MAVTDAAIAAKLSAMLDRRAPSATLCPSEVARALEPTDETAWRALMPRVRQVASQLAAEGLLEATRGGEVVDLSRQGGAGGPIRLRRPPRA